MKNIFFSLRMLRRNKLLLYVGIPGLAIGLSVVLLLVSYLKREYSFDQHFTTKDRVVRLYNKAVKGENATYGICLRKAYDEIPSQVAEVEAATQIYNGWIAKIKAVESGEVFQRLRNLYVDKGFLKVFDQKLLAGDKTDALNGKNKIVLTEKTALKVFGTIDCIGKQIRIGGFKKTNFTISGVVENLPSNSHIAYDFLVSMETLPVNKWGGLEFQTYFLFRKNTDVVTASEKVAQANAILMKPWEERVGVTTVSKTVLLKDIHFFNEGGENIVPPANPMQLKIISSIAFLVLLIALVNFMNLYNLHSSNRISEIAMRKSLGASLWSLVYLFFFDTLIMALIALCLALGLTSLLAPYFAKILSAKVLMSELFTPVGIGLVMGLVVLIILVSGIYPLLSLAKMNLALGVKGKTDKINRKNYTTKLALVLQFGITAFLITSVVVLYAQINYMKTIPLGFNPENVEGFYVTSGTIGKKAKSIIKEIEKMPFVESVGSSTHFMGGGCSGQSIQKFGSTEKPMSINEYRVHHGFAKTMQLEFLEGDYFSEENAKDELILNESAAKKLGLKKPFVGQKVIYWNERIIKGVVKDFYYEDNAGKAIEPLVLSYSMRSPNVIYVRTKKAMTPDQKMQIVNVFKQFDDTYVFNGMTISKFYQGKYHREDKMMKIVSWGALLAILLSISGLVALSLLNVNRRTKEIGVRKVMGSSEMQILILLIKQVIVWVLVACIIGFLVNYYVMQEALAHFVNHISISPIYFVISGVVVLTVALLAVGWQSYRAASRNPVEALRYE